MSQPSSRMRRIVLDAAGRRYDIALPKGDGLAGALAAVGVHLGAGERVLGPDGADVDSATIASNLREGGLYSVARPPSESKQRHLARGSAAYRVKTLPWAVIGFGSVAAMLAVKFGLVSISTSVTAIIAVLAAVIAVLASLRMVLAHAAHARAAATPMVVISALFALMAVVSPILSWSTPQFLIAAAAVAVVGIRAAPSVLVGVDPGYHLDYGRFMVLRWTVRGRVPRFIERVDEKHVREIVSVAEARLGSTMRLLSLIAAAGIPAAVVPVTDSDPVARIAGFAFVVFAVSGLLLTSRRTASQAVRLPPRIAALVGLIGFAVLLAPRLPVFVTTVAAAALLFAAIVAAVMVLPLMRGERSLGWSRAGDILDAVAVALVIPTGLIAAQTLNVLQGVLAG